MLEGVGDSEKVLRQEAASCHQLRPHSKPTSQTIYVTSVVTFLGKQAPLNAILQKCIDCDTRLKRPYATVTIVIPFDYIFGQQFLRDTSIVLPMKSVSKILVSIDTDM